MIFISTLSLSCETFKYPWCQTATALGGSTGLINTIYNYSLAAAGVAALAVIIYGGILWITSAGSPGKIEEAKEYITGAIYGIILLASAALLFNTINPQIAELKEPGFDRLQAQATQALESGYYSQHGDLLTKKADKSNWTAQEIATLYSHDESFALLNKNGIDVVGSGGLCANQISKNCTSLNGIPKKTINNLIAVKNACGVACEGQIVVTGGTENQHKAQGFGYGSIDVKYSESLYQYLQAKNFNVVRECVSTSDICPAHATGGHISFYTSV
ncbi:hypothetical protein HZC33_02715 [Candidatus Wolfebacteria bacterium]|nr:hypothetical protein [Candidatus Wolfebacteria bacterium]